MKEKEQINEQMATDGWLAVCKTEEDKALVRAHYQSAKALNKFTPQELTAKGENIAPPHEKIISNLLDKIEPQNFSKLTNKEKPNRAAQQIAVIDYVTNLANSIGGALCYNNQAIYIYNGAYWKKTAVEQFANFLGKAAEKMGVNKYEAQHYLYKEHLLKQFISSAYLERQKFDKDIVLINMKGGTLVIEKSKRGQAISIKKPYIKGHNPKDFLTYQLNYTFDVQAPRPLFTNFLNRVIPEKDKQLLLAEYLGYIFIRNGSNIMKAEKVLVLFGNGQNGKGVIFEIVKELLGADNICSYSLENLTDTNGYYRAKIGGKLLNYGSEIGRHLKPESYDRFKNLVSGEPIEARNPNKEAMQIENYAKLVFNCNELPTPEQTFGFFRRFLILPFEIEIPENERNTNLHSEILATEASGIFAWIMEGLERLMLNKKFSECESSKKALSVYESKTDSVKQFIEEENYTTEGKTLIKELYINYGSYCTLSGCKAVGRNKFVDRLNRLKYTTSRGAGNQVYANIIQIPIGK